VKSLRRFINNCAFLLSKVNDYAPQTSLGQQLWSIRQHAVAAGMPLQSAEAIAEEIGAERKLF
jgi:hypothetical protein